MAKVIMVQGTTSNAGKSFLAAALCRIFKQDGYRVAPFKSQNMALNSFITDEGLEMGRAQVMQAEAAGIAPQVCMNPVLLKPTGNVGSQVIVNGKVLGDMPAQEYYKIKKTLIPEVLKAYNTLAEQFDIIVIEGAGSPAEINLRESDFVNMGLAELVDAPVLLCSDIDRGGVFAHLYGTVALLQPNEQDRIKGMIINKFRGDPAILKPGLDMLEDLTKKSVAGVVPYLDVDIDDEDSLSERLDCRDAKGLLDIAIIRLPRLSNFTDFNPLEQFSEVSLRYVDKVSQLGAPDLVILPGTKNTMDDLKWLRQNGLEVALRKHVARGGAVVGICGGYQMLGAHLSDPDGVEAGGDMRGIGLLDATTIFAADKTRTQVEGEIIEADGIFAPLVGAQFIGYEIHMGQTESDSPSLACLRDGQGHEKTDGLFAGNVWGSYVHGIFERADFAQRFVDCLLRAKGLEGTSGAMDWDAYKEEQYEKLANQTRAALDMDLIYKILNREV